MSFADTLRGVAGYYRLFGPRGVYLATKARLLRSVQVISTRVPGTDRVIYLRVRTTDISTYEDILLNSEYELKLLGTPSIIVDAGANIGMASVYFAGRFPDARILAIEPVQSNFDLLVKNVSQFPNVIPIKAALWKEDTELEILDPGIGAWGFQVSPRNSGGREKVLALTIDGILKEYGLSRIDLLKIDIEGAEKEVFEHSASWIDWVGAIAAELHDNLKPGCVQAFDNATREFKSEYRKGETIFKFRNETRQIQD